ncbi:MAG: hypothetical protein R3E39_20500 [Anaerolineae bacterium]
MIRSMLMLVFLLLPGSSGLVLFGLAFIRQQPLIPAFAGFHTGCETSPAPCWYGIQPGVSTLSQALTASTVTTPYQVREFRHTLLLVYRSSSTRCSVELRHEAGIIQSITVTNCVDSILGDLTRVTINAPKVLGFSLVFQDDTPESRETLTSIFDPTCTNRSSYGAVVGRRSVAGNDQLSAYQSVDDILPDGWYIVPDRVLSCENADDLMIDGHS